MYNKYKDAFWFTDLGVREYKNDSYYLQEDANKSPMFPILKDHK